METTVEDLQWDIEKLRNREQKLNKHLAEAMEQVGQDRPVADLSASDRDPSFHNPERTEPGGPGEPGNV